jgi:hypothetical protein
VSNVEFMSSRTKVRDSWMVILGFMIGLGLGYGIIMGFYQPEIFRLQDEVRNSQEIEELDALMFFITDMSLYYIERNHPEISVDIPELIVWQGGRTTPNDLVGKETYSYKGSGWNIAIEWNVVPFENIKYLISATHDNLMWKGEIMKGEIIEIEFNK